MMPERRADRARGPAASTPAACSSACPTFHPASAAAFRCTGRDADRFEADLNHPLAGVPLTCRNHTAAAVRQRRWARRAGPEHRRRAGRQRPRHAGAAAGRRAIPTSSPAIHSPAATRGTTRCSTRRRAWCITSTPPPSSACAHCTAAFSFRAWRCWI
ncbi:MAG: hypothetical protein MZW92_78855 [Comamonadaceae bacterium]|nr:hypothetical protein [Comamonadaceae bacterium]